MIKAFFFDLDGTLVNTHEANYLAYQQAILDIAGVETPEILRRYIQEGRSSHEFLPLVLEESDDDIISQINERKKHTYKTFASSSEKNQYLVDFLKSTSKHHITALVTTAKRQNAETILKAHGLEDSFTFFVYGDEVSNMKPHPEAYELALSKAGVDVSEAIAFEDSDKGITAAEKAGLRVVHIKDFHDPS